MNLTTASLKTAQRIVSSFQEERHSLHHVGQDRRESQMSPDQRGLVNAWQVSSDVLHGWESVGRQVLSVHPELVEQIRLSSSSKIEPAVFRALPYINPMVVFGDPPELPSHTEGETFRLLGFIAYGKSVFPEKVVGTHDGNAVTFGAEVVIEVSGAQGSTVEYDTISFPMDGPSFTLAEGVDRVLAMFLWRYGNSDAERGRAFMARLSKLVIGSVMYLCSTTLEAQKVPRKTVDKALSGLSRKPFSLYRVGWQIGAALSARRVALEVEKPSTQPKSGYEQDPQHRRAHFKTVWTGERSRVPKVVFVAPYWTHVERLGVRGVNTVRKVVV